MLQTRIFGFSIALLNDMNGLVENEEPRDEAGEHRRLMEQEPDSGWTLWLTGLSGAGKSSLACEIVKRLHFKGLSVELLDGDLVRETLSKGLGFSKEDRNTNVRRIGFVANLLSRNGVCTIVAAISPYRTTRDAVRADHDSSRFVEVYVECSLDTLIARDVKGLYRKALDGVISNFTGVSDPYEPPKRADIVVHTDQQTIEESTRRILDWLERNGYLPQDPGLDSYQVPARIEFNNPSDLNTPEHEGNFLGQQS